uniref:Uncharacterized protein n=1 Tax=Quercus lobata TaxID=97700 RepID=A0A7N2M1S9_QUELO
MQQLCDKLAVADRTTKAEAQLKEKYQMRFKVLEERLKTSNGNSCIASEGRTTSNGSSRRQSLGFSREFLKIILQWHNDISTRSFDGGSRSLDRDKLIPDASGKDNVPTNTCNQNLISETNGTHMESANGTPIGNTKPEHEDYVSGMLYDMLQKEVVSLRKACNERDQTLKDKDDAIDMLAKKVDTLNKAMEVEAKKMRREVAAIHVSKEHDQRMWRISTPRGAVNSSHLTSARP